MPMSKSAASSLVRSGVCKEVFTFIADTGETLNFDVSELRAKLKRMDCPAEGKVVCMPVGLEDFIHHILSNTDFDLDRVKELTDKDLEDPPIFVLCEDGSHILVDGVHRCIRWYQEGKNEVTCFIVPYSYAPQLNVDGTVRAHWGRDINDMAADRRKRIG